jgi:hypothetical protein
MRCAIGVMPIARLCRYGIGTLEIDYAIVLPVTADWRVVIAFAAAISSLIFQQGHGCSL